MNQELARVRLAPADRALVQELCYGITRWRATLDWLIERRTLHRHPAPNVLVLARIGVYQIFFLDRIPPHAAVNSTVEAAKSIDLGTQSGFLNALLRNFLREAPATRAELQELRTRDPALGWSHPAWLVDRWKQALSPAELQALLAWNNSAAGTFARINTLKTDAGKVIEVWRNEGVEYDFQRRDWFPENLVFSLRRHPPLERLPSLAAGMFYVQDPSTLLAVQFLEPRGGERFLDLCAAPGGKATYLAQCLDNDGQVVGVEPDKRRRARLQENCERLGADVRVASLEDPEAAGPFDGVLVDAPCSNTGVLRRRLEVRWRVTPQELERATRVQSELLDLAATRVRPGGRIVYSTCSLEPEENGGVVRDFLKRHPKFQLEAERQLHPARDGVDGAYTARLRASAN